MGAQHGRLLEGDDGWLLQLPGWVVQLQLLPSITSCCWSHLQLLLPIYSSWCFKKLHPKVCNHGEGPY